MRDANAWACPIHGDPMPATQSPGHLQRISNGSPTDLQPISNDGYIEAGKSADNLQRISNASPADIQPISNASPHARLNIRTEHTTQNPEDKEQTRAGRALSLEEGRPAPEVQPDRKRKPRQLDPSTLAVWEHYRTRCPQRTLDAPPAYLAGPMAQATKQHGPDDVRLLVDWLADGDGRAEYLRREGYAWSDTPWRPSKLPPYLDLARAWDARGRTPEAKPAQRGPVSKFDAQLQAWNDSQRGAIIDLQPEPMPPPSSSFESMTQAFARYMPKAPAPAPAPTTPEPEDDIPF
jgi:hypothetical protein